MANETTVKTFTGSVKENSSKNKQPPHPTKKDGRVMLMMTKEINKETNQRVYSDFRPTLSHKNYLNI